MRRAATLAALALAAAAAVPAHADYPPTDCAAVLVAAKVNQSDGCNTIGALPTFSGRIMNVAVQTGQVEATLGCGGDGYNPYPEVRTIVVTAPFTGSAVVARKTYCWMSIKALVGGTTAVAVNRSGSTITSG